MTRGHVRRLGALALRALGFRLLGARLLRGGRLCRLRQALLEAGAPADGDRELLARGGELVLQLLQALIGRAARLGEFGELGRVRGGGGLQAREFRVQVRGALLGGGAQLGEVAGRGVAARAQVRKLGGHPGGVLFGGRALLGELADLARMTGGGCLQVCKLRAELAGALLGGARRRLRLLALAFQLQQALGLGVQQLLRRAQLGRHGLERGLQVAVVLGTQLRQRHPGVGGGVLVVRVRGCRRIEHRQLGGAVQVSIIGGRRRRQRARTHRMS